MTLILVVLEWLARIRLDMAFTTPGGGGWGLDNAATRFMPGRTKQFKGSEIFNLLDHFIIIGSWRTVPGAKCSPS